MDSDKMNNMDSRRTFIKLGLAAGCGAAVCGCKGKSNHSEKETVQLLSPDGEMVEVLKSQITPLPEEELITGKEAREGIEGRKFVMVIDLGKCNNARKCVTACQKMHHQPEEKEWLQVKLMKDHDKAGPYWFPKTCFHCDNPPCVKVCPVSATFKRDDGLVLIDNERCIGCKFCMAACPYSTRVFNWDEPQQSEEISMCNPSPETSVPSKIGTVDKCDFCPDMARLGKLPDCVTACPNGVFYFGDENEDTVTNGSETVRFRNLIAERAGYRYMEDLGTKPRVYYLPPRDRIFPVERGLENAPDPLKEMFKDILDSNV
ncbi:MAG: 4Fe-4S dicluster domain-containing protein [Saprospiraceae bacterium]|nr:4Fe-4S dicluster domain-containing protein [Saprospiraceae bacterium]